MEKRYFDHEYLEYVNLRIKASGKMDSEGNESLVLDDATQRVF